MNHNILQSPAKPNLSPAIRAELAKHGGFELTALLDCIRAEVGKIESTEAFEHCVAIHAFLDRAAAVATVVTDAGDVEEDHAQDADAMRAILRL